MTLRSLVAAWSEMAIAYGLAKPGQKTIVLDGEDSSQRAARGNFGLIWVSGKGRKQVDYRSWSLESALLWPAFAAELEDASSLSTLTLVRRHQHRDDRRRADRQCGYAASSALAGCAYSLQHPRSPAIDGTHPGDRSERGRRGLFGQRRSRRARSTRCARCSLHSRGPAATTCRKRRWSRLNVPTEAIASTPERARSKRGASCCVQVSATGNSRRWSDSPRLSYRCAARSS